MDWLWNFGGFGNTDKVWIVLNVDQGTGGGRTGHEEVEAGDNRRLLRSLAAKSSRKMG